VCSSDLRAAQDAIASNWLAFDRASVKKMRQPLQARNGTRVRRPLRACLPRSIPEDRPPKPETRNTRQFGADLRPGGDKAPRPPPPPTDILKGPPPSRQGSAAVGARGWTQGAAPRSNWGEALERWAAPDRACMRGGMRTSRLGGSIPCKLPNIFETTEFSARGSRGAGSHSGSLHATLGKQGSLFPSYGVVGPCRGAAFYLSGLSWDVEHKLNTVLQVARGSRQAAAGLQAAAGGGRLLVRALRRPCRCPATCKVL